jgi:DNA-binding MarR family transcriptional regulator
MDPFASAAHPPSAWDVIGATRRLHRRLAGRLDSSLEELGISYAQFELLELLTRDRNAHAAALARRLDVSRQIATRLLGKFDHAGLVELLPHDGGVRVPIVTRSGRRRIQLAADAVAPIRRQVLTIPSDRPARFIDVADDLDHVLQPPRQPWWFD